MDRICRQEPALLLGGRDRRLIFVGWNEPTSLLEAVTAAGWVPRGPKEAAGKFLRRLSTI